MAFSGPVEDRLAIRELVESYCDAVARRDAEDWSASWTEDAVWDLMGTEIRGRDAILQTWIGAMSNFSFVAFHANIGAIEIDGPAAKARVYISELLVPKDGGLKRIEGEYEDEFVKTDGKWRFSRRAYRVVHDDTRI